MEQECYVPESGKYPPVPRRDEKSPDTEVLWVWIGVWVVLTKQFKFYILISFAIGISLELHLQVITRHRFYYLSLYWHVWGRLYYGSLILPHPLAALLLPCGRSMFPYPIDFGHGQGTPALANEILGRNEYVPIPNWCFRGKFQPILLEHLPCEECISRSRFFFNLDPEMKTQTSPKPVTQPGSGKTNEASLRSAKWQTVYQPMSEENMIIFVSQGNFVDVCYTACLQKKSN